ncbi:MarR family transcriptional regulator [Galbitalea sp. SE-J8]|uniref:MarR family winged helix-turn-helix transcriptional regulator n=1 Tax=Galbitalea sp. SE-J8 TaxID=3054952 RepID=UPI00259CBDBF|nr:MarR family transcriptional regulator [Galbitalea sp. SE-J8]MDM4761598.1 MarR family transcriptional regulator [Galbitalea sp. SE-J8]
MREDDEVDLVIDAWAGILPDVDFSPLDVMSRLRRVARTLDAERARAFRSAGLDVSEFEVLSALRQVPDGAPLTLGELVDAVRPEAAATARRVGALAVRGLVSRFRPSGSTRLLIRLTATGAATADRAMRALVDAEAAMLEGVPARERAALIEGLRTLGERS